MNYSQFVNADLYSFQNECASFSEDAPYFINSMEMGLGKSITSLAISQKLEKDTLIVCPAYLINNWQSEIEKFCKSKLKYKVISYDNFTMKSHSIYGTVIFDESHALKNYKAKRTKVAHSYIKNGSPKNVMLLTGTAIVNRVEEIHSQLTLCYYGGKYPEFKPYLNYYYFCNKFCNVETKYFGGKSFKSYTGVKNADVLKELIKPVYFRRRAKDVLDLPKSVKQYIGNFSAMDNDLEIAWQEYEKGNIDHFSSKKAVNALAKVNQTCEFVLDSLQDQIVIIFTDHVDAANKIHEKLKTKLKGACITGASSNALRSAAVAGLSNGLKYIVATIGSMSTGVNLQAANYMVFNDVPFVPAMLAQAEKRIMRIGQTKPCFYYYVISSKIDLHIVQTINDKIKVINEVIGK